LLHHFTKDIVSVLSHTGIFGPPLLWTQLLEIITGAKMQFLVESSKLSKFKPIASRWTVFTEYFKRGMIELDRTLRDLI